MNGRPGDLTRASWLVAAAISLGGPPLRAGAAAADDVARSRVPGGTLTRSTFPGEDGDDVRVVAAAYALAHVTLRVRTVPRGLEPGSVFSHIAERGRTLAAVNGGYFLAGGAPDGLLVQNGATISQAFPGLSGVVGSRRDGTPFVGPTAEALTALAAHDVRDAQQSGPFVVDPGGAVGIRRDDGYPARRTVVLLDHDRIALVTTSVCGLLELARRMVAAPRDFGFARIERALNLDGGPSTGMCVRLHDAPYVVVPEEGPLTTVVTLDPRGSSPTPATLD